MAGREAQRREHQDVDLGMAEEPEEMLPEQRRPALVQGIPRGVHERHVVQDHAGRDEEARAEVAIEEQHQRGRRQRREGEQAEDRDQ
jgi:hypothetical protein